MKYIVSLCFDMLPAVAVADDVAARLAPARTVEIAPHRLGRVGEVGEEAPPALIHCPRVLEVAGIELGDETGIDAAQKGRLVQL